MPPDLAHMLETTDAFNIPREDLAKTVVGMAHFAGTGPAHTKCKTCVFFNVPAGKKKAVCEKYAQLTGDWKKPIEGDLAACRYFERRSAA